MSYRLISCHIRSSIHAKHSYMFDMLTFLILFNPLSANWDCLLLDQGTEDSLSTFYDSSDTLPSWQELANPIGYHSCDMVLDFDEDGLPNFLEETYSTNPNARDSDMDLLDDIVEIGNLTSTLLTGVGEDCNIPLLDPITGCPVPRLMTSRLLVWTSDLLVWIAPLVLETA